MRTKSLRAASTTLAAVCALALAGCAPSQKDTAGAAIIAQVRQADPQALGAEKPVIAVCAALKVMAANPRAYGLADLQTDSPLMTMGVDGAAKWSLVNAKVAEQAGKDWLATSPASQMFMRDYIVFSSAVSENLDPETTVSTPEMESTKRALRSVQAGCSALFKQGDYAIIK